MDPQLETITVCTTANRLITLGDPIGLLSPNDWDYICPSSSPPLSSLLGSYTNASLNQQSYARIVDCIEYNHCSPQPQSELETLEETKSEVSSEDEWTTVNRQDYTPPVEQTYEPYEDIPVLEH